MSKFEYVTAFVSILMALVVLFGIAAALPEASAPPTPRADLSFSKPGS